MNNHVVTGPKRLSPLERILALGGGAVVLILGLLLAIQFGGPTLLSSLGWKEKPTHGGTGPTDGDSPKEVHLTGEKLKSANLQEAAVEMRQLRETRTVPGKITYDTARHLDLTASCDCIVAKVLVQPAQRIKKGEALAVLSSSEIGLARDETFKREAELAIARKELAWSEEIAKNVEYLLEMFTSKPSIIDLEKQLTQRALGDYREKLLGGYSKMLFAETVLSNTDSLENKGTLSPRIVQERRSTAEVAKATFQSACETTRFDAGVQRDRAKAAAEQAERLLKVSHERLSTLMGPQGTIVKNGEGALSEFMVVTPLEGWVQDRHVAAGARVPAGKPLFTVADTTSLWVSAEIHERDWRALNVAEKAEIKIRVPAMNNETFSTHLRFVGSQVGPETHSVPLVADLDNAAGRFRPGMFVWVDVPLEQERTALVVPAGAIMRHENQPFVFVPAGEDTWRRVDVKTGLESHDVIEIVTGLEPGQKVVTHGSFYLKSELLLEREPE